METKFKTNIKCSACVAKVTSALNEVAGENNWKVDLTHPDRVLTLEGGDTEQLNEKLKAVGYTAEKID